MRGRHPQNAWRVAVFKPLRLLPLLASTSLGALALLMAGRSLLLWLPRPTPDTPTALLTLQQHSALNPERRREAALLRASAASANPAERTRLLAGQGWGTSPLAAVVLKQQALDAKALGATRRSDSLWRLLLRRAPAEPASADGLYALGQRQPALRSDLLRHWPAHPAALAAASERQDLVGALHLARWGPRWNGGQTQLEAACRRNGLTTSQRQQLAQGLAALGADQIALRCLAGAQPLPATTLLLANAGLQGDAQAQRSAIDQLVALIKAAPDHRDAAAAVTLLSEQETDAADAALNQLPQRWQATAALQIHRAQRQSGIAATLAALQRWPQDPASWELQWQQARKAALAGRWDQAHAVLSAGGGALEAAMPVALAARRSFWLGLADWQRGRQSNARQRWRQLLATYPGGYYGWRAASRLGLDHSDDGGATMASRWNPLQSGIPRVDLLWRLGQPLEAWEAWRTATGGLSPDSSAALQAEGRLREAIGDGWTGQGLQERAALRVLPQQCQLQALIETERYRPRQRDALNAAARSESVPLSLLLGVAKQESRFQADARSVVGATGLLQLMPDTAAELAGRALSAAELAQPQRNAQLGGRYLHQLLARWKGNPILAVASYNAGPNAVAGWLHRANSIPEVWVEAIPYPETRHYVKTVLGNRWSFAAPRRPRCR